MTAEQFRAALRYLNMSQYSCSVYLCVSSVYVNQYAKGKRVIPDYIAKMLNDLADNPDGVPADFQRIRRTKQQLAAANIERIRKEEGRR